MTSAWRRRGGGGRGVSEKLTKVDIGGGGGGGSLTKLIHGWEHKISKSRQTQATGGKNCEKAGKLPRLCGDIIQ